MSPVANEAIRLFYEDMTNILNEIPGTQAARRRLHLFNMMYGHEPAERIEPMAGHAKKVLLLLTETGEHVVCDEYYPTDAGRVHIIPQAQYGQFNRDQMELEYQKVSMVILEIVYEDFAWPDGMVALSDIYKHFGVPT